MSAVVFQNFHPMLPLKVTHVALESHTVLWVRPCEPPSDTEDEGEYRDENGSLWAAPCEPPSDTEEEEEYRDSNGSLWAVPCEPPSDDSDHGNATWAEQYK